jgi:hypothetical protein
MQFRSAGVGNCEPKKQKFAVQYYTHSPIVVESINNQSTTSRCKKLGLDLLVEN